MSIFQKNPLAAVTLLLGGSLIAITTWLVRLDNYAAIIGGAITGFLVLLSAGRMALRTQEWWEGSDSWAAGFDSSGQRVQLLLVAVIVMVIGVVVMWFGFGPGESIYKILLVGSGLVMFLCGVLAFIGWIELRRIVKS